MSKNNNPMQLTLRFEFTNPTAAVVRTLVVLAEVADLAIDDGDDPLPELPGGLREDAVRVPFPEGRAERAKFRRLAGCISIARGMPWHDVWVIAYHRFFKETGFHPVSAVSESIRLGLKTHLDFIFTDPAWPGVLHDVLDAMLTESPA